MTSLFRNARQSAHYAVARPSYPTALYQRVRAAVLAAERTTNTSTTSTTAADIGCGTGQATLALADYFDHVTGLDPSPEQLEQAEERWRQMTTSKTTSSVSFVVGTADHLAQHFAPGSLSCVTAAQAAHWFDLPAFYAQVHTVLRPGGVLAMWCYGNMEFPDDPKLQSLVMQNLYEDTLGPYWDERRHLVEGLYADLKMIGEYNDNFKGQEERIGGDEYDIRRDLTLADLSGYIRSWSGYVEYCKVNGVEQGSGRDPIRPIEDYFSTFLEGRRISTVWPVRLLLSVKQL
jgi:ubiquinone/menaquinone biosynthesis C-methylase UbiE